MENIKLFKICKFITRVHDGHSSEAEVGCILTEKDNADDELLRSLAIEKYGKITISGGIYYKEVSLNEVKISDLSISEYILLNQAMKGVI